MDALSPTRTCDPWAVHSAKTLEQHSGSLLTELQKRILDILRQTGGITPGDLAAKLGIPFAELEREFASLRHMEKARAQMKDGSKILVLW
jgi:DNA-binding MarR family transcriptional regulator